MVRGCGSISKGALTKRGTFVCYQNQTILYRSRAERKFGVSTESLLLQKGTFFPAKEGVHSRDTSSFFKWGTLAQKKGQFFHFLKKWGRGGHMSPFPSDSAAPAYGFNCRDTVVHCRKLISYPNPRSVQPADGIKEANCCHAVVFLFRIKNSRHDTFLACRRDITRVYLDDTVVIATVTTIWKACRLYR